MGRVNSPFLPFVVCVCLCLFSVCNLARGETGFITRVTFDVLVDPLPGLRVLALHSAFTRTRKKKTLPAPRWRRSVVEFWPTLEKDFVGI